MKFSTKQRGAICAAVILLLIASHKLLQAWTRSRAQADTNTASARIRPRVVTNINPGGMSGLYEMLNLTEDQRPKVEAIITSARAKMSAIRNDATLGQKEQQVKMHTVIAQTLRELHPILRPDQQQKLEQMHKM